MVEGSQGKRCGFKTRGNRRLEVCIKFAAIFFGLFILIIVVLADLGILQGQLDFIHSIPYGDKIAHILLLGVFTFLVISSVLQARPDLNPKRVVVAISLLLAVLASMEETSQLLFRGRHAGFDDLLANFIGIAVFSTIALHVNKKRTS